jgi:hypothetical protein
MLQDKFGRPFKEGQAIVFFQQGMTDAIIKKIEEESVLKNPAAHPVHSLTVEITFCFPVPHGANVQVSNIAIAKEPEAGLSIVGSVKH